MFESEQRTITIMCSNYNSRDWIEGYLDAVNKQTLEKFDIIIIDAKSTDDSLSTIKKTNLREGINRTLVEEEERIPIYAAWNKAVRMAKTDYVVNWNTDDRMIPTALKTYEDYTKKYPEADLFYPCISFVGDKEHTIITETYTGPEVHSFDILKTRCYPGPFPLVKKESIISAGMFREDLTIVGDHELWLRMAITGMEFIHVPQILGTYYLNPVGFGSNPKHQEEAMRQVRYVQSVYNPGRKM